MSCNYFVTKKNRHCRLSVKSGHQFCPEHEHLQASSRAETSSCNDCCKVEEDKPVSQFTRIPCPYDNAHTCYSHRLEHHKKRCNARPTGSTPTYLSHQVNSGEVEDEERIHLSEFTDDELQALVLKVNCVYKDKVTPPSLEVLNHEVVSEASNPDYRNHRHKQQNSSLLGHLQKHGLLNGPHCYVEMGSGRGELTYWLTQAISSPYESCFVLVDRSSHRHKHDNRLKGDDALHVRRIRADIEDLRIDKVDLVQEVGSIVGISKHLCGSATDLTLRCLCSSSVDVNGILIALCCHHRCSWKSYVGRAFLQEVGFTVRDFSGLCGLASWATCGIRPQQQEKDGEQDERTWNLTIEDREEIGRRCKLLLDEGRLRYLRNHRYTCYLLKYVESEVSLENVALLAKKN